jgi:hypothetical protein
VQLVFLFGNVVLFIRVSRSILSSRDSVGLAIQPEEKRRRAKVRKKKKNVVFAFLCRTGFPVSNMVLHIFVSWSILSSRVSVGLAIQPEEKKRKAKVRKKETNVVFAFLCRMSFFVAHHGYVYLDELRTNF